MLIDLEKQHLWALLNVLDSVDMSPAERSARERIAARLDRYRAERAERTELVESLVGRVKAAVVALESVVLEMGSAVDAEIAKKKEGTP